MLTQPQHSELPMEKRQTGNEAQRSTSLADAVKDAVHNYFREMGDQPVTEMYEMVLSEIEAPLLEMVLDYTNNNQSRSAELLGLNRGTLRKKLKKYGML